MLKVSDNQRILLKNEEPFFFLADTLWSAFTNIELNDWVYYLNKRKQQGFNVLQINLMPQWDRSRYKDDKFEYPFEVEDGYLNINTLDEEYFNHAEKMLEIAVEKGFIPALVLLWCNYIPDTWAGKMGKSPYFKHTDVKAYTKLMVDRFKKFDPIYLISGDTDFPTKEVTEYYVDCLNEIEKHDPDNLKVLHIKRGLKDIPVELKNHRSLDLYFYQSGHNAQYQEIAYEFAEYFYQTKPTKPVINSEPCYELMAYSRNEYGRFSREDVRKVAWQSIFSGAFAGITYGAHGIWSWHDSNSQFGSDLGEGFSPPFNWRLALEFSGADDYGFLKDFYLEEGLENIAPNQDLLINETKEIRVAETDEKIYIYLPVNVPLVIEGMYDATGDYAIDLNEKLKLPLTKKVVDGKTKIEMTATINDSVLILNKQGENEDEG